MLRRFNYITIKSRAIRSRDKYRCTLIQRYPGVTFFRMRMPSMAREAREAYEVCRDRQVLENIDKNIVTVGLASLLSERPLFRYKKVLPGVWGKYKSKPTWFKQRLADCNSATLTMRLAS